MSAASFVVRGATVFDGTRFLDGTPDVEVVDGAIGRVGADLGTTAGTPVVDGAGRTLLPGLIDCHVHVLASHVGGTDVFSRPPSLAYYESVGHLRATLRQGITTARDAGGADLGTKLAVERGLIDGPRLKLAVSILSQTGGHGDMTLPSGVTSPVFAEAPGRPGGVADGVDGVRLASRRLLRAGADHLKIATTGGVLSPSDDPRHTQFTVGEVRAAVEEAEAVDRYVMAHAQGTGGILMAVRAGVRSIEHGIYLDDECIQEMLDRRVVLVPTLVAPLAVIKDADAGMPVPANVLAKARRVADDHAAAAARAVAAGVMVAMGTDSGVGSHGANLEELAMLQDAGLSVAGVLASATSVAAGLIREPGLGRVAEGATADLVLFDGALGESSSLVGLGSRVAGVWQSGVRKA